MYSLAFGLVLAMYVNTSCLVRFTSAEKEIRGRLCWIIASYSVCVNVSVCVYVWVDGGVGGV